MIPLKQFVPQEVCLACDGCCRYAERASVWSPLFLYEEIEELTRGGTLPSCVFSHAGTKKEKSARIDLTPSGDHFICPCFDEETHHCGIYLSRPLDCRLYPFVLVRRDGRMCLGVDLNCPYIREHVDEERTQEYVRGLQEFLLSPEFESIVRHDPGIFQEYPSQIRILAVLNLNS